MKDRLVVNLILFLLCSSLPAQDITGYILDQYGNGIKDAEVIIYDDLTSDTIVTNYLGEYIFTPLPDDNRSIKVQRGLGDDGVYNGIEEIDMLYYGWHILNDLPIENTYNIIAADLNNNGHITMIDFLKLRNVILAIVPDFQTVEEWEFIRSQYQFVDPLHPVLSEESSTLSVS